MLAAPVAAALAWFVGHSQDQPLRPTSATIANDVTVPSTPASRASDLPQQTTPPVLSDEPKPPPAAISPSAKEPPKRPRSEKGTGRINCELEQWAEIFVDGHSIGVKEIASSITLPVGAHKLVFSNAKLGSRTVTVEVHKDATSNVHVDFESDK
jgi:hypothetical protein